MYVVEMILSIPKPEADSLLNARDKRLPSEFPAEQTRFPVMVCVLVRSCQFLSVPDEDKPLLERN